MELDEVAKRAKRWEEKQKNEEITFSYAELSKQNAHRSFYAGNGNVTINSESNIDEYEDVLPSQMFDELDKRRRNGIENPLTYSLAGEVDLFPVDD